MGSSQNIGVFVGVFLKKKGHLQLHPDTAGSPQNSGSLGICGKVRVKGSSLQWVAL